MRIALRLFVALAFALPAGLLAGETALTLTVNFGGKPAAKQAIVLVTTDNAENDNHNLDEKWAATTDDKGVAQFSKLSPGDYRVMSGREFELWSDGSLRFWLYPRPLTVKDGASSSTVDLQVPGFTLFSIEQPKADPFRIIMISMYPRFGGAQSLECQTNNGRPTFGYVPIGSWSIRTGIVYNTKGEWAPQVAEVDIPSGQEFIFKPAYAVHKLAGSIKIPKGVNVRTVRLYQGSKPGYSNGMIGGGVDLENGRFDFGVILQSEYVVGASSGFDFASALVNLNKDRTDITLEFPAKTDSLSVKFLAAKGTDTKHYFSSINARLLDSSGKQPVCSANGERSGNIDSEVSFQGVPVGTYMVETTGSCCYAQLTKATVKSGATNRMEIAIQPAAQYVVTLDQTDKPVNLVSWCLEDPSGKPLPLTGQNQAPLLITRGPLFEKVVISIGPMPRGAAKIRVKVPGYKDFLVPVDDTLVGKHEVSGKLDKLP